MSYSRRQLYALGETFGDSATRMEAGGRIVYGGGGGGGAPQPTTTITESEPTVINRTTANEIPQYLTNASQDLVAKGAALTSRPYEAYTGARVAEFSPLMNQAFQRMGGQQVAGQTTEATGLASLAGQRAMDYGQFQQGVQQYMNPYMQGVVDIERRKAQEAADQQSAMLSGQAAKMGAFGGSGAALQQRALRRDTAQQLADLQAQGLDRAYQSAVGQYNQGISSGLAASGQLAGLGQQQFGQEMDITKGLGTAGDVQRQREQALLDVGYGDYLTAQKYPYEQLAFQQSLVSGVPYSTTQRTNEVSAPGKQVSQQTSTKETPSAASQLAGAGLAMYGASGDDPFGTNASNRAAGGEIKRYADGGITSLLSDQQIAQRKQMPISDLARLALQAEEMERARAYADQQNMMAQQAMTAQGPTVAADEMNRIAAIEQGIGGLEVRDDLVGNEYTAAGGGIVAFQNRGEVPTPEEATSPFGDAMRGVYNYFGNVGNPQTNPRARLSELQAKRARTEQGLFEALTAAEKQARQAEITAIDQAIAAAQQDLSSLTRVVPVEGRDTAVMNDESRKRANASSWQSPAAAGAAPGAKTEGIASVDTSGATGATTSKGTSGAAPAGIAALLPKNLQALQDQRRKAVEDAAKEGISVAEADLAAVKRDKEELGQPGVEREKRLKAQEESLKGAEDKGFNMALIEAGLAIMAGNSANAFENIGKGAMVGTKAYRDSMAKIDERRAKLDEALMRLDELRYDAKKTDMADVRAATSAVGKAKQQLSTSMAGVLGEEAKVAVDLYTENQRNKTTLAAAGMRSSGSSASGALTPAKRAELADKANDNVTATLAKDMKLNMEVMRNPARREQLVQQEFQRLLNAAGAEGTGTASAPDLTKWGKASVE